MKDGLFLNRNLKEHGTSVNEFIKRNNLKINREKDLREVVEFINKL
jgi:hypothetical protein